MRLFLILFLLYSTSAATQITINEILASNALTNADPQSGAFSDWVELHNGSNMPVSLTGWALTDDADEPQKWLFPNGTSIPAGGFLLLWADGENTGLHTSFKFSADGERAILVDAQGVQVDEIKFGAQLTDISFGRKTDGTGIWGFFTKPTPEASNTTPFFTNYVQTAPHFTVAGGFYDNPVTLEIQSLASMNGAGGVGQVHYTTNGAEPNQNSPIFVAPLTISTNTVVKARVFRPNQIPGPVVTHTYFIGEDFEARGLAVLSLSGDPAHFWASDSGLLVTHPDKPLWERPVHLEFYENDGLLGFHHDAGASVGGENAWLLPQKLLNIFSRKQYGGGQIEYQIFPDNPRTSFEDLILRTSGNDWSNTLFRDGMQQAVAASTADLDVQSFRPVATFVNGNYYGIYNLREKQDKEYLQHYHGIGEGQLDYIENDGEVKEGDVTAYEALKAQLNAGVSSDIAFEQLEKVVDVQDYTDYIISQAFGGNTSWGHNIALFREKSDTSRWRWLLHDHDRGFTSVSGTEMDFFTSTNGASWSNPPFATLLLRKMLDNAAYKQRFIQRFADHLYITWNPAHINRFITRHSNWIKNEIPYHVARWEGTTSSYGNAMPSVSYWESEVDYLRSFSVQRNAYLWDNLNNFFGLSGYTRLTTDVSAPAHGSVRLHDMAIPSYPWNGQYFSGRPFTLTAVARPGFVFDRWEKSVDTTLSLILPGSNWKYYDGTVAPAPAWKNTGFNDASWAEGAAELGYGDGDEATLLSFGGNAGNKTPAYFFRQNFEVTNPAAITQLQLRMVLDDGAVAYLNGQEIWRYNMGNAANIAFNDFATDINNDETAWFEATIPATALVQGQNVLAVEVHQASASSSDISFNAALTGFSAGQPVVLSNTPVLVHTLGVNPETVRAIFESDGTCGILPDTIFTDLVLTAACSPYKAAGNVVLRSNATLTIQPGVQVWMPEQASLWVEGTLWVNGTENAPVTLKNAPGATQWGGIFFKNTPATSNIQYLTLVHAGAGVHRVYYPAAISAYHAAVQLDHINLTEVDDNPVYSRFSEITLTNSVIQSRVTGDGINIKQGKGRVENCVFTGGYEVDMDAIDFDGVTDGIVRNNIIHDFRGDNNDGLDIGEQCKNLLIEGNFIYHCFDKGISVGQQSTATIRDNTIAYTAIGIALKDQSPVSVDHCTLFGNQYGIYAYEKNPGALGGIGAVTNCVVSNAAFDTYIADSLSSVTVTNSLSDPYLVAGTNIWVDQPHFLQPTWYDFHFKANSLALGAGTDGLNLGALTIPAYTGQPQLMFSEILYNDTLTSTGEFLEIHNPGTVAVDLEGYTIASAPDYVFPAGATIAPGAYIVVAQDASAFAGAAYPVFQWTAGQLANEGERLMLYDGDGLLVDMVRYDNHLPWPEIAELQGRSLELVENILDNHFASSWKPSPFAGGSPGAAGGSVSVVALSEIAALQIFPNPTSEMVFIRLPETTFSGNEVLSITNAMGQIVYRCALSDTAAHGLVSIALAHWASGHYYVQVAGNEGIIARGQLVKM